MQQSISIGIGWDIGGWLGSKQAVAVVREIGGQLVWLGAPQAFKIETLWRAGGSVLDLIRIAWPIAPATLLKQCRVILAIDAPLGFPIAFQQLQRRQLPAAIQLQREIDNRFAYRETERWIYHTFGKKPLSAPFDRLGNNATVAMYHAALWNADEGFRIAPFQTDDSQRVIIEVYPALVKEAATGACAPRIARLLPPGLPTSSDVQDAAICAVHALAYALHGKHGDLPPLTEPPAGIDSVTLTAEGWIYHFPSDWLSSQTGNDSSPA